MEWKPNRAPENKSIFSDPRKSPTRKEVENGYFEATLKETLNASRTLQSATIIQDLRPNNAILNLVAVKPSIDRCVVQKTHQCYHLQVLLCGTGWSLGYMSFYFLARMWAILGFAPEVQGASAGHRLSCVESKSTTIACTDLYFRLFIT